MGMGLSSLLTLKRSRQADGTKPAGEKSRADDL
jgi:hypothetical protein